MKAKLYFLLFICLLNFILSKKLKASSQVFMASENTYTVVAGDTLHKIAMKFNTTVDALVKLNDIKNPDLIFPGQVLKLS